jgi:hypothetical protein
MNYPDYLLIAITYNNKYTLNNKYHNLQTSLNPYPMNNLNQ